MSLCTSKLYFSIICISIMYALGNCQTESSSNQTMPESTSSIPTTTESNNQTTTGIPTLSPRVSIIFTSSIVGTILLLAVCGYTIWCCVWLKNYCNKTYKGQSYKDSLSYYVVRAGYTAHKFVKNYYMELVSNKVKKCFVCIYKF